MTGEHEQQVEEAGQSRVCIHKRWRVFCAECGGTGLCTHGKRKGTFLCLRVFFLHIRMYTCAIFTYTCMYTHVCERRRESACVLALMIREVFVNTPK